jgi:hypothetical protein
MQPTATIPHPNRPGEFVVMHLLSRHEEDEARNCAIDDARVPVAIKDNDTHLPLRLPDGSVASLMTYRMGIDPGEYALSDALDGWTLNDSDGKPIPFVEDKRKRRRMIHFMNEEPFDVILGEGAEPQRFTIYLRGLRAKRETFIPNPSAPADSTV